ncbi:hypothetical protein RESH_04650 [Rhodopirellula europaea SH398]|uniref:Uncharacterized protein n=1 Tax=Rhodopirellula europaea SH398 TaxID=1263868 RepID=M5RZK5_9BACT|nr:hypothetical protein RESH_04650 [Rhodopirellula europaea SH398]
MESGFLANPIVALLTLRVMKKAGTRLEYLLTLRVMKS